MRRKVLLVAILIIAMLLQCVMPFVTVNATTSVEITLNSNVYKAVKAQLKSKGIKATYMDANEIISISQDELAKVTELDLSCSEIDDLDNGVEGVLGLEAFVNLEKIDLHGNYLTAESNLDILDSFAKLKEIDLSTNQISSVKSISTFHDADKTFDITEQKITGRTIIAIDDSEETESRYTRAIVNLPDILFETEEGFDPLWIWNENVRLTREIISYTDPVTGVTTSPEIDFENSFDVMMDASDFEGFYDYTDETASAPYPYMLIKVAEGVGTSYHALKGLIKFKINVEDSRSILKDSEMVFYYAIVDEEETGIAFDDGYFYRATKAQLTEGQTINNDQEIREVTDVRDLYSRTYDEALIMVIDTDDVINNIPTLILNDQRIKDLRGLEEFVGLESDLDISYNYITTIKRIIELEENKGKKEQEIRDKYNKILDNLKTTVAAYDTEIENIKEAQKNYEKAMEEYAGIDPSKIEERTAKYNEAQGYLDAKPTAEAAAARYATLINKYIVKLYKTYEKEYKMVSLLPSSVNHLSYGDLISANLDTIKGYSSNIIERVTQLEQTNGLTAYENWAIQKLMTDWGASNGFVFKTEKVVYTPNPTGGDPIEGTEPIEYPISEFFSEVQADTTLDLTDWEEFVYIFKCIDVLSQVEQYSLIKRQFEGTTENYVAEAIEDIEKLYNEKGYDLYFYSLITRNIAGNVTEVTLPATCLSTGVAGRGYEIDTRFGAINIRIGLARSQYTGAVTDYGLCLAHKQALITSQDVADYITLPRIRTLNMADNKVRTLEGIEALTELKELNAWKNMVHDISNVDWSAFNHLRALNLGYNQISDISPLQVLYKLVYLNVSYNLLEGRFTFRLINMRNLMVADFSHNQYSDIQYANDQFILRAMGYDADGDGIADGYTVPEYLEATGVILSFQYQTLEMEATIVKNDDEYVEFELPLIFRQLESMDNARTSFGVNSVGGLVEPEGTTVKLRVTGLGEHEAIVSVEGRSGYGYSIEGVGYGTTCTIKYKVVDEAEAPATQTDPTDPTNPTNPSNPVDPTTLDYGYPVHDGYVLVYNPETLLTDFTNRIADNNNYTVAITENRSSDKIATGSVVTVVSKADPTVYTILEVVVKGDINGDGEVDALDSGIIRNVINDIDALVGVYQSAADVNNDGDIDSQDAMLILQYRADRITCFED